MRLRGLRRRQAPVRCPVLPGLDPLYHLRSGSGLPLSLGGNARKDRGFRLLVNDDIPRRADGRLHLRMEEGSSGMGVSTAATLPPGSAQDLALKQVTDEL